MLEYKIPQFLLYEEYWQKGDVLLVFVISFHLSGKNGVRFPFHHFLCMQQAHTYDQALVALTLDSAFHRIYCYRAVKYKGIHLRYPVDCTIHLLNNWGLQV